MKKKRGRPSKPPGTKRKDTAYNINAWIDPMLGKALEALADRKENTKTAELELAIANWLDAPENKKRPKS